VTARGASRLLAAPFAGAAWAFAVLLAGGCGGDPAPASPAKAGEEAGSGGGLAADERIRFLLAPCSRPEPFLADTTDMVPALVAKLEKSQLDPLRGAKEELVELGDAALPELRRFCQRVRADRELAVPYLNALAVVTAMETHAGRDLLVAGLEHPQDVVRIQAAEGLGRHAGPEDFDRLATLAAVASPEVLRSLGAALETADRARYEDAFAAALAEGKDLSPLWDGAAKRLADTKRPEILAKFREAYPRAQGETRAYLAAAVAASGDAAALEALRGDLRDENAATRKLAVAALEKVGLARETAPLLAEDKDETVRGMVAQALAALPPSVETSAMLHKGLLDRAKNVRQICLSALAARGDTSARDLGLQMFEGGRVDFEQAITALREAWKRDPEFAARTLELLVRLRTGEAGGLRVDAPSVDRAIAQLPIVDATRFLYDAAKRTSGFLDGIAAHRWFLIQASNTGAAGRAWLRDRWSEETDPTWRVDIAAACAADRDATSLEFLLRVVDDERTTPLEILHAANLLVHQGPASVVAPRLKRVTLRIDDPKVRPALNCLLWQWYGEGR
jgi:HEAT repeat protein